MLDFGLFTSVAFNIIFFAILVLMLAYFIPFAFINVRAIHKGIDEGNASFLISIMGNTYNFILFLLKINTTAVLFHSLLSQSSTLDSLLTVLVTSWFQVLCDWSNKN